MKSILAEVRALLSVRSWIGERIGTSAEGHGLLLAWDSALAFIDELPGPPDFRTALAAAITPSTAEAHLIGFSAGIRALEVLDRDTPSRGYAGAVGAGKLARPEMVDGTLARALALWNAAKDVYPALAEELDSVDQESRVHLAQMLVRQEIVESEAGASEIVQVAIGFEKPATPRVPTRSGFIAAMVWRDYVLGLLGDSQAACAKEVEMCRALESALGVLTGNPERAPSPVPWSLDLRCVCGASLEPSLFCCDPQKKIDPALLAEINDKSLIGPCPACGDSLPGFVCDACGTPNTWTLGIVAHRHGPPGR